jgi:hypothetical protein
MVARDSINEDFIAEVLACARYGETEELKELLDTYPDVKLSMLRDSNGNTPLHMCCANGHLGKQILSC